MERERERPHRASQGLVSAKNVVAKEEEWEGEGTVRDLASARPLCAEFACDFPEVPGVAWIHTAWRALHRVYCDLSRGETWYG